MGVCGRSSESESSKVKSESEENGDKCVVGRKDRVAVVQQLPATSYSLAHTHQTGGRTGNCVWWVGREEGENDVCKVMAVQVSESTASRKPGAAGGSLTQLKKQLKAGTRIAR